MHGVFFIAFSGEVDTGPRRKNASNKHRASVPTASERRPAMETLPSATIRFARDYCLDAVVLLSMLTTCTRRLASASGWPGSFSLVSPYPTVTRSASAMPYLSVK